MKHQRAVLFTLILAMLGLCAPATAFAGPAAEYPSQEKAFSQEALERQFAVQVALGKEMPTRVLRGATVFDSYTKKWRQWQEVIFAGPRIAFVGPVGTYKVLRADGTKADVADVLNPGLIVDLTGYWIIPSFVEAHNHNESYNTTPDVTASVIIPFGVTCLVEAGHELGNALSSEQNSRFWYMAEEAGSPLTIRWQPGSAVPPTGYEHTAAVNDYTTMMKMYQDYRTVGLDEVMNGPGWQDPENPSYEQLWGAMEATWKTGRIVSGHLSRQYDYAQYQAGAAAGFQHDHEVSRADAAYRKMSAGIGLLVRPGNLDVLKGLLEMGVTDWSRVAYTTDDRNVAEAMKQGTMNSYAKAAMALGIPTIDAFLMGTLYPAEMWNLDRDFGSVAPGRYADVSVLRGDPRNVDIHQVYAKGELWAENGKLVKTIPPVDWPEWAIGPMRVREITSADFEIRADKPEVTAALWQPFWFEPFANPTFITTTLTTKDGVVQLDPGRRITQFCMVDRYNDLEQPVACMAAKNVGPATPRTALAMTEGHDAHVTQVLTNSHSDAAVAVNRLRELGGGYIIVHEGEIIAEVALPIGGLMSSLPAKETAQNFVDFWKAAETLKWFTKGPSDVPAYSDIAVSSLHSQRFATLTCSPWGDTLMAPSKDCPSGYRNVITGKCKPVVW